MSLKSQSTEQIHAHDQFVSRHVGPSAADIQSMLKTVGFQSLTEMTEKALPQSIKNLSPMDLPAPLTEQSVLEKAQQLAKMNKVFKNFIGLGYYGTLTPGVIQRNILENPAWYTAYTPYQAEIAQGRLEALLNFQTMIMDLTGLDIANSSLLDEGTAAAEAMSLAFNTQKGAKRNKFYIDENIWPQTLEVIQTRAEPLNIELVVVEKSKLAQADAFAIYVQNPGLNGVIHDFTDIFAHAHAHKTACIMAADPLALCLMKSPAEMGADIAVGSTQRFGVPMGFGGPHAGYLATKDDYKRLMPGRIVGVSVDSHNKPALRLALQTREQHIRREKATSNICTAQVLLAVMASMYAVYHGPNGLKKIATDVRNKALSLRQSLNNLGFKTESGEIFDTVRILTEPAVVEQVRKAAHSHEHNYFFGIGLIQISVDESTTQTDLQQILNIFAQVKGQKSPALEANSADLGSLARRSEILTHPVFNTYHSETEMLRYIFRLQQKDLSLVHSMIPLGSCTMKLNASAEMAPVTWPEFAHMHPFAPSEQTKGFVTLIKELEGYLAEITGFNAVSLQPNAGSQGEYAGLLVIRKYHQSRGEGHRNICLIPSSAHGTNPASAVMAGMKVVVVACDDQGNIDLTDLKAKAEQHSRELSALMVTYPSTHGVFEETIVEICKLIHAHGGQVYMDGANMNALVGVARPGQFGADVSHLNLHKTFCIPHGGGGPGVGPIGVAAHLAPFLPTHSMVPECGPKTGISAVSSAPWGSALILVIPWAYIAMMGSEGLKESTQVAILNANYIAKKLEPHYPILYKASSGLVAHECILDTRPLKANAGVGVDDIAKRLMDYGFHAPTMSWPVVGTLMIEPTESESKAELDRFIESMIMIKKEADLVAQGTWPQDNNPLRMAPHTLDDIVGNWDRPYDRKIGVYPTTWIQDRKFFPAVNRIDNAHGDKNLVCSCLPLEDYQTEAHS